MTEQQKLTFNMLQQQLDPLMLHDRQRFTHRLHGVKKVRNPGARQAIYQEVAEKIEQAAGKIVLHEATRPEISHPENLPVNQKKQNILEAIRGHQMVIVTGETGSGKTTQSPKICMELGCGVRGLTGHTQPRRLAAHTVANRIAGELQTESGDCIDYKVHFSNHVSDNTMVRLMADGILLAEIQQDRLLMQYNIIIIDEAYERGLNIDFLLGYLKELLPCRPDLKIIITSTTIGPERFSKHLGSTPIIEVSGWTYPVGVHYHPIVENVDDTERDQLQAIFDAVDKPGREGPGDILIFTSGEREICDTADALDKLDLRHTEVLPLYTRLSNSKQNHVLQSHSGHCIVLATSVTETSLTVPDIRYVIDPGTVRISRYSYRAKTQHLPIEPASQASTNQREGRCGRVSEGICIRLYSEDDLLPHPEFTDPEILHTNPISVILQMTALGLGDIAAFPFVEAPDKRSIQDDVRLLEELEAITTDEQATAYKLTPLGHQLSQLPVDPRLARIVLEVQKHGYVCKAMIIISALSVQGPRERPMDKQQASDEKHRHFHDRESNFLAFMDLWSYLSEQQKALSLNQFRRQCKIDFLNYLYTCEWQDIYTQLRQVVEELGIPVNNELAEYRGIHVALLTGLLSRTGMKDTDRQEFTGAHNARFSVFSGPGLFKKPPKWTIVAELVETSRLWGRIAARIDPEWVEPAAQHLIKRSYSEPHWKRVQGTAMTTEEVIVYGLPIVTTHKVNYSQVDLALCHGLFIRHALVEGGWQTRHTFFRDNLKLRNGIEGLEHKSRRRDILVDGETMSEFYDQRISHDVVSTHHFDSWWKEVSHETPGLLNFEKSMLIKGGAERINKLDYPNFWHQGNLKLRLSYQFEPGVDMDGVIVHIPLPLLNQIEESGFE